MGLAVFPDMNANSGVAFAQDHARLEMGESQEDMIATARGVSNAWMITLPHLQ